ncbi:ABC transporter substrate-binding protein [Paenibacillus agricola]|jgi:multiple sugar transport system substrate-binding protein|uniref:Extracellular solute-binding protein n=1 Tax=Paenibacillus agricola TaxID=2716264 RepID=A0ABX0JEQ4_9BACL|nr:extracellular solute-binding protein [Paenibacillus agricola]NHN32175.1 extracellular solute-binding protein [Paenibacillus agricola]
MKKRYAKITLVAALASLLTSACAPTPAPSAGSAESGQKVKVSIWSNNRTDVSLLKEKIQIFNDTNKSNIEIDYQVMTDNYEQALQTAMQSGDAPDLMNAKMKLRLEDMVKMKVIEPLDTYLTPDIKQRYGDSLLKLDRQNYLDGHTYSLPNYGTTWRVIYNKDLFAKAGITEPPKSLSEMVDYAKRITEAGKSEDAYGFGLNMKNPTSAFERALLPMARLDGKNFYDWKTGKYDFSVLAPYAKALKQIVDDKSMLPGYENLDIDPLRNQFAAGKVGMYLSLSSEPSVYDVQFPTKINWGVAQVPTVDGTQPYKGANYVNNAGVWWYMSAQSKHKKETFEVMNYLYSDDVLVPYYEQGKGISVVPSVLSKAKTPTLKNLADFAPKDDTIWPMDLSHKVEGKTWQSVIAESILGLTPLDEGIEDLNKRYNDGLDKEEKAGNVKRIVIPDFDPRASLNK